MSRWGSIEHHNVAKFGVVVIGVSDARHTGMARPLILLLLALTGCANMVRMRGTYAADTDVGTIVTAAAIAAESALETPPPEALCDEDTVPDPPHTCPAHVQEPR
jgi:hypothetical protein